MITTSSRTPRFGYLITASAVLFFAVAGAQAQKKPAVTTPPPASTTPDRAAAYYHFGLAHLYEDMAVNAGRSDYATQAVEEYKLALSADPNSTYVQDGLADLYFKIGRIKEAVPPRRIRSPATPTISKPMSSSAKSISVPSETCRTPSPARCFSSPSPNTRSSPSSSPTTSRRASCSASSTASITTPPRPKSSSRQRRRSTPTPKRSSSTWPASIVSRATPSVPPTLSAAVPVDDRTPRIEFALGASYDQLHKSKEAIAAYRRAADLDPDNVDAQRGLATALLNDNQLDEALKVLQAIVTAEPQDATSQIHIAEIQRRQGHYDAALDTLEKAKVLEPDSLELTYNEALVYDSLGRYDDATGVLVKLLAGSAHADGKYTDPEKANRAIFLDRLGIIYREQNKTTEAVAAYKQILDLGGSDYAKSGYQGQIDAYRDAHMWKEATAVSTDAAKAFPKDKQVQLMYAAQLADTGSLQQGVALAKAQLAPAPGGPEDRDVYLGLAQIYIRANQYKEASDAIDKAAALAVHPDEKMYIAFIRGTLYDRQKLFDQSEAEFRKALAIDPNNATVLNYLGYSLADRGVKLPEALTMIQKAVELDPQNGAYLDSLGWVYFKSGQYALAEENLRKANERINTDPTVHDHLGEVYEKTGKLKLAVAQWERSMTEYAHSLPADADPADVAKVQRKLENARVKLAKLNTTTTAPAK